MKISYSLFFSAVAALGTIAAVTSCEKSDRFAGSWQGSPERMTNVPDAADATSTMTIDFAPSQSDKKTGTAAFSTVIEVTQATAPAPDAIDAVYETNITATASISAKYVFEDDDDEDILLSFDQSSLKVDVDPSGVAFSENLLSQTERPVLDSLTASTAEKWRVLLSGAIRDEFMKYNKIEDIKIHHNDMMSCEVAHRDLTFRRVGIPD